MLVKGAKIAALEAEPFCTCTDVPSYCWAEHLPRLLIPDPPEQPSSWGLLG